MKRLLLFLFTSVYITISYSQVSWIKYTSNPVLTTGPDIFDIIALGQPSVLFENDTIKMWYAAAGNDMKARICYAYSLDGVQWIKNDSPVIDVGNPGTWDCGWLDTPEIVRDASGYKMFYYGDTTQQFAAISSAMGMAYSTDGIHWTKHPGNPVFTKGNIGDWDGSWVESPAVIYDDSSNLYMMWYNGIDTSTWKVQIGLATSSDGVTWTRNANNPVLSAGAWGEYDDMWLGTPAVIKENGIYKLWYSSASTNSYNVITEKFDTINMCYASSADGVNWMKYPANPLFNNFTAPHDSIVDNGGPWACDVVYDPNEDNYKMWYETSAGICFASSVVTTDIQPYTINPSDDIFIFPNPARDELTIENKTKQFLPGDFAEIFDIQGRKVFHGSLDKIISYNIDLRNYTTGQYFVKIQSGMNLFSQKIEIIK